MNTSLLRARALATVPAVSLALVVLVPAGSADARGTSSLQVTPGGDYVAGQKMTFTGNIGASGIRRVHLQSWMGRPGDTWTDIPGTTSRTKANGSFSFAYPSPSMFGIQLRVRAGKLHTPGHTFNAKSQDLTVSVPDSGDLVGAQVRSGQAFSLLADTTPSPTSSNGLTHRPDLPPPPIPGRTLTLQKRGAQGQWVTLGTTVTNGVGEGTFTQTLSTVDGPTVTYRVREEDWTKDGNRIGWFPSFPFTVDVMGPNAARQFRSASRTTTTTSTTPARVPAGTPIGQNGATASKVNGWGAAIWDFAWEYGESLDSPPYRGSDRHGRWQDSADGTGRVAKLNGGLILDSGRKYAGDGDRGTTRALLRENPATYGRWEVRLRTKRLETGAGGNYHALVELVPDRPRDYHCGAQNITVADVPVGGSSFSIGARNRQGRKWTRTLNIALHEDASAFGLEVTHGHVTWFFDGQPIGTVNSPAAVSDVPMTLRLSLVGDGAKEMNHTQYFSDWERGWDLSRGNKVTSGATLKSGTFQPGC